MKFPGSRIISGGTEGQCSRGIEPEQAQVDLDVAVGRLDAAEREDALARPGQFRVIRPASPATFSAK